ncbi:MAG: BatA domain-containing protein [Phycisphaerales bacterium JB063]
MTFFNIALLGGVFALAIPLAIHLLSKSRFRRVDWAAMFLLEQVMKQNRRRVRIEQLIMLLVRCAIPVLLALAMAQPVLTGWNKLFGDAKGSTLVLLDASYSMQASDPSAAGAGVTRYDRARGEAGALLTAMPSGSEASVVRIGGGDHPLSETATAEPGRLVQLLEASEAGLGVADSTRSLRSGAEQLGEADTVKRDLVLISDFQRLNWSAAGGDVTGGVERQRLRELLDGMEVRPNITLIPVGSEPGRNCAVSDVTLSSGTIGVGQRVQVKATLLNTGAVDAPNTPVRLIIDGGEVEQQRVTVKRGQTAEVLFFHRFTAGGDHTLEVATGDDILPADDVFRLVADVLEDLPVLLVSGDRGRPFPENETDFLEVALEPFAATPDAPLADLVRAEVIAPEALNAEALADMRVVVLANVTRLSDPQVLALRIFVQRGGALLVFPGDRTDTAWMNEKLADLMPATLDGLSGVGLDFETPAGILDQRHDHPALALWNDPANGSLSDAEVRAWFALGPRVEGETIARLSTGHPLLTERGVGEGAVLLCATSCDADWSNLPARAFYLPFMQRLITYAATRNNPPRNIEQGRPIVAHLASMPEAGSAQWVTPDGSRISRPVEQHGQRFVCELEDTQRPGYYRLITPDRARAPILFASNAPRDESQLEVLTGDELDELAASLGAEVVADAQAYAELEDTRRHGTPIWHMVWMGLLALLFGELLLQQWFGKGGGR